jgi:hypothetical protein
MKEKRYYMVEFYSTVCGKYITASFICYDSFIVFCDEVKKITEIRTFMEVK